MTDYQINPKLVKITNALRTKNANLCWFLKSIALEGFHRAGYMEGESPFTMNEKQGGWADFIAEVIKLEMEKKPNRILIENTDRWLTEFKAIPMTCKEPASNFFDSLPDDLAIQHKITAANKCIEEQKNKIIQLQADVEQADNYLDEARTKNKKLEEAEGSVCPEDVGFVEYIKALQKQITKLKEKNRWIPVTLESIPKTEGGTMLYEVIHEGHILERCFYKDTWLRSYSHYRPITLPEGSLK